MAEWRMPQVVRQSNRFHEIAVHHERRRNAPRNLRHLKRVRQASAVQIALRDNEYLRLVLQPAERRGVQHAVSVALELGPVHIGLLVVAAPRGGAAHRVRSQRRRLECFARRTFKWHYEPQGNLVLISVPRRPSPVPSRCAAAALYAHRPAITAHRVILKAPARKCAVIRWDVTKPSWSSSSACLTSRVSSRCAGGRRTHAGSAPAHRARATSGRTLSWPSHRRT